MPNMRALLAVVLVAAACGNPQESGGPPLDADSLPIQHTNADADADAARVWVPLPQVPDAGIEPDIKTVAAPSYNDVAPLLRAHCQECHSERGIAPFPLTSFEDARYHHAQIAAAVSSRHMPPWLPEADCQSFRDARGLSFAEIETIVAWSAAGALPGGTEIAPPTRAAAALPWIDQTVELTESYQPQPNTGKDDDWRCFILDPKLNGDHMLIGFDLQPSQRGQIHHGGIVETTAAAAAARDAQDAGLGWTCNGWVGVAPARGIGSWAGGFGAVRFPEGTGIRLNAGHVLVVQLHYTWKGRAPVRDRTRVDLQFARTSVKAADYLSLSRDDLKLKPRTADQSVSMTHSIAEATTVWGVQPHMHKLGRGLGLVARAPGAAASSCLMDVKRWDVHGEELFFYRQPLTLPARSVLGLTCVFDNPSDRTVGFGLTTDDEMCDAALYVTTP